MPRLMTPDASVRESFLIGERAAYLADGLSPDPLDAAEADFAAWAAVRAGVQLLWEVPVTERWYVDDDGTYLGTVVIRHRLTPALLESGGHLGYHVVPAHRRRGHASAMVAAALPLCRGLGLRRLLVTCHEDNLGSRRVIERNGGVLEDVRDHECRYWLPL